MGEWQPIETAPKDGTVVLIYSPADGVMSSHLHWGNWQGMVWRSVGHVDFERSKPTHWMPLPAPPKATTP